MQPSSVLCGLNDCVGVSASVTICLLSCCQHGHMVDQCTGPEGPPRPPGAWESVLRGLHGVMGVFGRITMLVDENTYAVNFFIQALLQLLDRCGGGRRLMESLHGHSHSAMVTGEVCSVKPCMQALLLDR